MNVIVSGSEEEPDWSKYRYITSVDPLPKRGSGLSVSRAGAFSSQDMVTALFLQQEARRDEELQLVHLTETWRDAIDSGLVVGAAFIDFKKAFGCVDHDILLNKLQCQFGIRAPY